MEADRPERRTSLDRRDLITIMLIVCAALIVRSIALGSESLWIDEVMTARRAGFDFMELLRSIGERDHLPLYYIFMMGWARLFGTSEVGLRSFSVLAGGLSIIPIYLTGRRSSRRYGSIAGMLACALPVHVYFGQEAKMYSLLILLSGISFFSLLEYIEPELIKSKKLAVSLLLASNILLAYTHYYSYLFIFCELLYISYLGLRGSGMSGWRTTIRSAWPTLVPLFSGVIWVIFLLSEGFLFSQRTGGGISLDPIMVLSIYPFLAGAYKVPTGLIHIPLVLTSITLLSCVIWGSISQMKAGDNHRNGVISTIFLLILPLLALALSIGVMNIFGQRYFLVLAPVVIFLAVIKLRGQPLQKIRDVLLVAVIISSVVALPVQYAQADKDDWRGIASYLGENMEEGDVVIPVPFWEWRSISYYDPGIQIIFGTDESDLDGSLEDIDRVWVVVRDIRDDDWTLEHMERTYGSAVIIEDFTGLNLYLFTR